MKTTLDLRNDLLVRAKTAAARERTTLTRMVEEGLQLRLRRLGKPVGALAKLPISTCKGGLRPGIDPTSNRSMFDADDR